MNVAEFLPQTEPQQPRRRQNRRRRGVTVAEFAQSRLDIAADLLDLKVRPMRQQLGAPPDAASGHPRATRQFIERRIAL